MKHYNILTVALLICLLISPTLNAYAQTDLPVMRAVLFYSPTCGHCEYVITETLIPLTEKYAERLQIIAVDVSQPASQELFFAAMHKFGLEQAGVPFLVFDDTYLIGSGDIPEQFPKLVESYLAQGGLDWPNIPGLAEAMEASQNTSPATPTAIPVVRAVYFYRSACTHCQKLTEEVIPPLVEKYGAQLEIFGVDVSSQEGDAIYNAAIERFTIERFGVPTVVLGDQVLVGGTEIEEKFAGIIEGYFAQGGMDWPDIPGLQDVIANTSEAEATAALVSGSDSPSAASPDEGPGSLVTHSESSTWLERFAQDPAGNTLSVIVLSGMIGSVVWAVTLFRKSNRVARQGNWGWTVPVLCLVGFGVAGYLAYVETAQVDAVCGPVGDCNTVQQSEYARLFGILPIGVLGLLGYVAIFTAWLMVRYAREQLASPAVISLFVMTALGTLFSIYLTFLEPFVIGATCIWCLTSAVLMTALMLLSVTPAKAAMEKLGTRNN
jgi:uncharacterized membrane protein/thiol-disulfide isomerase/thioredoxin